MLHKFDFLTVLAITKIVIALDIIRCIIVSLHPELFLNEIFKSLESNSSTFEI